MNTVNTFWRVLLYGIRAFRRNIWLSIIAIITMTMTLLMISVFALGDIVVRQQYQELNKKIDYLIFLKDEAREEDINLLLTQIKTRPEVKSSTFVSKDDARQKFEQLFQDDTTLQGVVTEQNNPLPREITVKFEDPRGIAGFNSFVTQERFATIIQVTSYKENSKLIDHYIQVVHFLKLIGVSLTVFFIFIAALVVLNTIRLTIHSRKDEIEVMRLVGATPSYIRGPFLIEGVLYGLISAVIAALISWSLLTQVESLVRNSFNVGGDVFSAMFGSTLGNNGTTVTSLLSYLFVVQVSVGLILGIICSVIAVRRYLKE